MKKAEPISAHSEAPPPVCTTLGALFQISKYRGGCLSLAQSHAQAKTDLKKALAEKKALATELDQIKNQGTSSARSGLCVQGRGRA